jgi:hypothetical protein
LVPLSDRRPLALDELGSEDDEQIAYEFEELEPIQRLHIDELFWTNGIPHAWDDTSLVVREEDEEAADKLIDDADRDAFLTSGAEQVSYELAEWNDTQREQLVDVLDGAGIEHAWDEHGELVVLEHDEERVDAILDSVEFPEALPVDDSDDPAEIEAEEQLAVQGLVPQDVLSELFVAADRLKNDPLDHEGVLSLVDAARLAETLPLPYGFAPAVWRDLLQQVEGLRVALEGEVNDEKVMELATELRTHLRSFV